MVAAAGIVFAFALLLGLLLILLRENARLDAALEEARQRLRETLPVDYEFRLHESQQRSKDRWR